MGFLFGIIGLLVLWVAVMVVRAMMFVPESSANERRDLTSCDEVKAAHNLAKMIQCETVSLLDAQTTQRDAFEEFKALLVTSYPLVHGACERTFHGPTGILYKWSSKEPSSSEATVLMSHYDVVPAEESLWSVAPFGGQISEGYIWGRGTLDTKGTLCGILEAAEALLESGFSPVRDVYFSFSGDEETSGPSAPAIVAFMKAQGIRPALVLDEGGAIVEGIFPGVKMPVAVVGTGEKGYLDVEIGMQGAGGHSSTPPPHSLLGFLAKAVVKLERRSFKAHLSAPVRELFTTLGRHSSFAYRLIFANLWCTWPLLNLVFTRQGGKMNALIRTTMAVTRMSGSDAYNVLPPKASVGLNLRLMAMDSVESAMSHIKRVVGDKNFSYRVVESREASPISSTNQAGWEKVRRAISGNWPEVIVSPYLMLAATDSRHFCDISDCVLRFSPMPLSDDDLSRIHGNDERIAISQLVACIDFYRRLMLQL
jgi:carboxypeptidase PM20D1